MGPAFTPYHPLDLRVISWSSLVSFALEESYQDKGGRIFLHTVLKQTLREPLISPGAMIRVGQKVSFLPFLFLLFEMASNGARISGN
jgi:hypothetical protein